MVITIIRHSRRSNLSGMPEQCRKCLVGHNSIRTEVLITATTSEDKRGKNKALSLAKECYSVKLELLTNATVVDDAIRLVSSNRQEGVKEKEKNNTGELSHEATTINEGF